MWGKLIIRNLLHDFKRTVVSILCLGVSVLLIFVTMASFSSYQHMRRLDAYEHYGKYHLELRDISAEEVIKIRELLGDQVEFEEVNDQECDDRKTLCIRLKTCTEEELNAVMLRVPATLGIPLESFLDIDKISESEDGPLYITLPDVPVMKVLNEEYLLRVFSNLISNAVKYSDGDLKIEMTTEGKVRFENHASKLDKLQVERLFDRFYTVQASRESTGLGLTVAKLLTEKMGGEIHAEFEDGILRIEVTI